MDSTFLDRVLHLDVEAIDESKIRLIHDEIISQSDWDVFQAGKAFPPAESLCQWAASLCTYHFKKRACHFRGCITVMAKPHLIHLHGRNWTTVKRASAK